MITSERFFCRSSPGAGSHQRIHVVANGRASNKALSAIDNDLVAATFGARGHAREIAANIRFGHCEREKRLASQKAWKQFLFLSISARLRYQQGAP